MNSTPNFHSPVAARKATDSSALEHLAATVNRLVQAERRQVLTHYGFAGLFWGISVACVAVLAIRLWPLSLSALPVSLEWAIFTCMLLGLIAGLSIGWVTRRSPLAVAILADIRLDLKQQLSSAWELYESNQQSASAAGIAHQLLKSRTPVAEHVFPLSCKSGNAEYIHAGVRWGRLVPAVALLLLLLNTLNFEQFASRGTSHGNNDVQREGSTLRIYGASLAQRAHNNNLEASTQMAKSMRQLGRRMEGGTLARGPALERLSELRRDISNVRQRLVPRNRYDEAVSESEHTRARNIIENAVIELANGTVSPSSLRDDNTLNNALVTANINTEAFRIAAEDAHNGDPESLEEMLQQLRDNDRAARDAAELERAYERVQSIRENLGAQAEAGTIVQSGNARGTHTDDDFADQHADPSQDNKGDSPGFVFRDSSRPGGHSKTPNETQNDTPTAVPEGDQPSIRPAGKIVEGREVIIQTRIVPKQGEVTTPMQTSNPQQRQKLEAILAKESLPSHQKAYVRRYFLELSRAVNAVPPVSDPTTDEPSD